MSCGSTALGTLSLANRVADMKAYSSVKRRQGDGQLIAGPALLDLGVDPALANLLLRYGAAKPVLETRRADARVVAWGEALIVQLYAEVECVDVCGYLPCVSARA